MRNSPVRFLTLGKLARAAGVHIEVIRWYQPCTACLVWLEALAVQKTLRRKWLYSMRRMILSILFLSITSMHAQNGVTQEQTDHACVGMTCGTCPMSIRHRALQLKGVQAATVDLATAAVIYEDREQSPQTIAQAITRLGYPATIGRSKQ